MDERSGHVREIEKSDEAGHYTGHLRYRDCGSRDDRPNVIFLMARKWVALPSSCKHIDMGLCSGIYYRKRERCVSERGVR